MSELSCSCTVNKNIEGVGEISALISKVHSLDECMTGVGELQSPNSKERCDFTTDITSSTGEGPLYDIRIEECLEHLKVGDSATITHSGYINPNLSITPIGGEGIWFSPLGANVDEDVTGNISEVVFETSIQDDKDYEDFKYYTNYQSVESDLDPNATPRYIFAYRDIEDDEDLIISNLSTFSFSAWFYVHDDITASYAINKDRYSFNFGWFNVNFKPFYELVGGAATQRISVLDGDSLVLSSPVTGWVNLAGDWDGTKVNWYVNNESVGSTDVDYSTFTSDTVDRTVYFGTTGRVNRNLFKVDDIRFFPDKTLSESERTTLYRYRSTSDKVVNTYNYQVYSLRSTKCNTSRCNSITLQYIDGDNGDLNINQFCDEQTTIISEGSDDGCISSPEVTETTCELDAQISFCYSTDLPFIVYIQGAEVSLDGVGDIEDAISFDSSIGDVNLIGIGVIDNRNTFCHSLSDDITGVGTIRSNYIDKYAGSAPDFYCADRLYPISDDYIQDFVNSDYNDTDLYNFIDEGIYEGSYPVSGVLITDDALTFIQPSSIETEGNFTYRMGVTNPSLIPEESCLILRASAPIKTYESTIPPKYTVSGIKLEDKYGNLITQYEDLVFFGDADRDDEGLNYNFTSYFLKPSINNAAKNEWLRRDAPKLNEADGYTLSLSVTSEDIGAPFTFGFNRGFKEDGVFVGGTDIPSQSIRISAIEICNSGSPVQSNEDLLPFYLEVSDTGRRIQKCFYPTQFPLSDFDTGIDPVLGEGGVNTWYDESSQFSNTSKSGSKHLLRNITDDVESRYIVNHDVVNDSGKLILRFGHTHAKGYRELTDGAFGGGFDQNLFGAYFTPSGAFNTKNSSDIDTGNSFFLVEDIKLMVLAKKAIGTDDYVFDVVGYSDDCLLNVTSPTCGFLQNISGVFISNPSSNTTVFHGNEGAVPVTSGFADIDDLGIDGEAMSDKDQYFIDANGCDDHYKLTTYPKVTSTDFKWYEVPLKIYDDDIEVGRLRNYSVSSLLERLYLDIYPLPSGASISNIHLCVTYKPQDGLNLATQGGEKIGRIQNGRSEGSYYPTSRQSNDNYLNAGSGYNPLSLISGIPHAYASPETLKTNYSRRWRGMNGLTYGDFDVNEFGFGFYNPQLDSPLVDCYLDFSELNGNTFTSRDLKIIDPIDVDFDEHPGGPTAPERYKNLGFRFTSDTMFGGLLPGYTGLYRTADWTSLSKGASNFQSHELYGQIFDGYDSVVRFDVKNSLNFPSVSPTSGISLYARFIPDVNVSGVGYNFYDRSTIFTLKDTAPTSSPTLEVGFLDGYLYASGEGKIVSDTTPYSGYQYPLSVLVTYDNEADRKIRLYTDNELYKGEFTNLRGVTDSVELLDYENLYFGYAQDALSGLPMLACELGFSTPIIGSGTTIVDSDADRNLKQITASDFFDNQRMKFFDPNESHTNDTYELWDYVNENTYSDWSIGDFKYCEFSPAFSIMQKRTGRDLVAFHIASDGEPYYHNTDISIPSVIDSGLSYHSQIENDFIRFHMSDTPDNFYSVYDRISKNLPAGYKFAEKALVVETVLEHKTTSDIIWDDGSVGPKLVVSLYTKNKDPYYSDLVPNLGLMNRVVHHIEPSSCFMRIDTTFTHDSICDNSEPWSTFPTDSRLQEFSEKFFSQDVDDMFIQYDLIYPSGQAYESDLYIHTAHVRAEDAFVHASGNNNSLNLVTSGDPSPVDESFNLLTASYSGIKESGLNLNLLGPILVHDSGFNLIASGDQIAYESLNLSLDSIGFASESGLNLNVIGDGRTFTDNNENVPLFTLGKDYASGIMPLTIINTYETNVPEPSNLDLFLFATEHSGIRSTAPLFVQQNFVGGDGTLPPVAESLALRTFASPRLTSRYRNETLSLSILNDDIASTQSSLNLTLYADNFSEVTFGEGLNLSLRNCNYPEGSPCVYWYNNNYGTGIELEDEAYTSILANDEIRGVDLFGYGSCTGDSPRKAIDEAIITDDTVWREETCNDGGIFRATSTYTNLDAGYSGDYYGIRKYTGLIPNSAYLLEFNIRTGQTEAIKTPRNWEEWEYGTCGPDTNGDCCPDDCETNINFSGIKLIGDYPYLSGDLSITEDSGRLPNDNYGKSVSVKKDLIAIGSPNNTLIDEGGNTVEDAGAIFLYRRNEDVAGLKAAWQLEDKLTLPSGYVKDYISRSIENLICYPNTTNPEFCISGQKWNIGQEGRELGYSVDVAYSGEREIVVAGAPKAAWNRNFDTIQSSGIPVGMLVFTDKFLFNDKKLTKIHNAASKYDILYKYFSAPWVLPEGEFQPKLDIKLLICHVYDSDQIDEIALIENRMESVQEDWFAYQPINSLVDGDRDYQEVLNESVSGIKNKFLNLFQHTGEKLYSGIPPIVGVFGDDTFSTSNTASYSGAMVEFLDFYREYAYESGVSNLETDVPESGYINRVFSDSFEWDTAAVGILEETLSTGNLIQQDSLHYITSGVGQEWARDDSYEFQIPPDSGGRVYIFENESGKFNFIQELISPEEDVHEVDFQIPGNPLGEDFIQFGKKPNDRFGHSVSISENGEVIAVGSPYSQEACRIYERDESENTRMYENVREWLVFKGKTAELARYDSLITASGEIEVAKQVYHELNQSDKYLLRSDKLFWGEDTTITLYRKVYDYHYDDIPYIGTWKFIANEFAGTSRLGYSSAVSEDGDLVAFGAPTDSFNEFEDINVWYEQEDTWASYTNAGAVRMFESRKYYPHNKVVEFYKFGNLDRSVNATGTLAPFYDQMELYFNPVDIPFERTSFDTIEIPKDAGLAFIITPEIDAASDEIIDNIKTWLSYGDRTLVLVGNDPIWEDNGLYFNSNEIINKILEKLDCRMRIVPARNEYESLQGCVSEADVIDNRYNAIESFVPEYSHETDVQNPRLFAKGVADIKLDVSDLDLEELLIKSPCDDLNTKCELPIQHMGDLRSQWNSECVIITDLGTTKVEYKTNWPFHFDNPNPAQTCSFYPEIVKPEVRRPNQDARPILAAAEYYQKEALIIPADSGVDEQCTTYLSGYITQILQEEGSYTVYDFDESQEGTVEFSIQEGSTSFISGIYQDFTRGRFFDPDLFDDRDGLIQAAGTSFAGDVESQTRVLSEESVIATEEVYYVGENPTTSKVFIMASMLGETEFSLGKKAQGDSQNYNPNNDDQNITFYNNLVMKDCDVAGNIDQLGGWTGSDSFSGAFSDSKIANVLLQGNHTVASGVVYSSSEEIKVNKNIVWIANPVERPSDRDIERIKTWLNTGDKKLVLTYSNNQEIASNITYICDELNLNTKPFYLDGEQKYFVQDSDILLYSNQQSCCPIDSFVDSLQLVDSENIALSGCSYGYNFNEIKTDTETEKVAFIPENANSRTYESERSLDQAYDDYAYIPINIGDNTSKVIYFKDPITEIYYDNPHDFWKIEAESEVEFAVKAGSGYRMFVNWVSESDNEKFDIELTTLDVKFSPDPSGEDFSVEETGSRALDKTNTYKVKTTSIDFRVPADKDEMSITFDTNRWTNIKSSDFNGGRPLTPRVLSVSGCLLPINETVVITEETTIQVPVYITECSGVPWFVPEQTVTFPEQFRAISTLNDKYCSDSVSCEDFGDQFIADGPVIVAEELEHFTGFTEGKERSKIVVVTDSTIVQGQCPHYRNDSLGENQAFIRGLYPKSPEKFTELEFDEADLGLGDAARKFSFSQKLRAPERGSAAKYYATSGVDNLPDRHGLNGVAGNLSNYTDGEDDFVPGDVYRRFTPITQKERDQEIETFGNTSMSKYGVYPRYSGMVGDEVYVDAPMYGGIPRIMKEGGYDYLDWELLNSGGFPGDLFGYSIDIHENKLVVGSPFSAFEGNEPVSWSGITDAFDADVLTSGLNLSQFGGPGAAYYYEKTGRGTNAVSEFLPWEFKQKIKTDTINVGIDNATSGDLNALKGGHNLPNAFVEEWASYTDRFGYSVSIDSDFIAVGAPAHDFNTIHDHIYSGEAAYIRKEFNNEFDIPQHDFYDLGSSGNRDLFPEDSGKMVLNNGAIFTFRHELTNWFNRTKEWTFAEKIQQHGFSDRNINLSAVSGSENDFFGHSVSLHRARRGDSDYVMVGGAPNHNFPTSGNHITLELDDAGAAYTYDAMLREQTPNIPNSGSYIDAQVFGSKPYNKTERLLNTVYQNTSGDSILYTTSGLVFSNNNGDIFLEVSGHDPSTRSFVAHRPYVESVIGKSAIGTIVNDSLSLFTEGKPVEMSGSLDLSILGDSSAIVYNNLDLYVDGIGGHSSGDMNMFCSSPSGISSETLNLYVGIGSINQDLNLRIRGK